MAASFSNSSSNSTSLPESPYPSYYLPHHISIDPCHLEQFGLVKARLIPPQETIGNMKLTLNSVPNLNTIRKEAIRLERNLMRQHKKRAADIIKENRERAVTYWAAQQLLFHMKCKERGVVDETITSPEVSFVLPLHLPNPPKNGNIDEALKEHEKRVGLVHRNFKATYPQSLSHVTTSVSYYPETEFGNEWEYDGSKLSDPLATLLSPSNVFNEKMISTRFYLPVSSIDDSPSVSLKGPKAPGRKPAKKKLGVKKQVLRLYFQPFVPQIDRLGVAATDLINILRHGISQNEYDSPPVTICNWMILLPYQMRSYHRRMISPSSIQSSDDTSEENRVEVVTETSLSHSGFDKDSYKIKSLPIVFMPTIIPLPKSLTWIKLRDNYRVDDQTVLRYIPYFGDDDTIGFDMSAYEYVPWELEGDIGGEVIETTISSIMSRYQHLFENEELEPSVKISKSNVKNEAPPPTSLETSLMKVFSLSVAQLRQAKKHGDLYADLIRNNEILISHEFEQKLITRHGSPAFLPLLLHIAKETLSHHLDDSVLDEYGFRKKSDYKLVAENYLDMFCRRCYKYDCRTHGIEQPRQRIHEDPPEILVVNENGAIITETSFNRRNKRKKNQLLNENTGNDNPQNPTGELGKAPVDDSEEPEKSEELRDLDNFNSNVINQDFYQTMDGCRIPYAMYQKTISNINSPNSKKRKVSAESSQVLTPECIVASRLLDMILTFDPTILENEMNQTQQNPGPSTSSSSTSTATTSTTFPHELPMSVTSKIAFLLGTCRPQDVSEMCFRGGLNQISSAKLQLMNKPKQPEIKTYKKPGRKPNNAIGNTSKAIDPPLVLNTDPKEETEKLAGPLFNLGTALTNIRKDGFSLVHQPCDHEGPCVLGICECVDSTGYCETDCACSSSCKNRFQGCKCTPGQCRTLLCRCVTASRECDPNLCQSCGVAIHPFLRQPYCQFISSSNQSYQITPKIDELASRDPRLDRKYCQNTQLLLNAGKKVSIGRSSIHGWGLFLREDVKKGDFIIEYSGEIISQDEAERRGKLFDKIDSSFLFNLSTEYVIDATRKGSKAKFANHSKDDPNCGPRIKLVKGDHRIGIFALKNLTAGTELTFDYLYAGEEAPRWACKSAKRNDFLL